MRPAAGSGPRAFSHTNFNWQTIGGIPGNLTRVPDRAAKLQRQFGQTIRTERKARELTQQQLAFEASLSLTYIGEIERGQRMVSLDTLQRLAGALKMTAAELLQKARI
jgi:ribosome-binding protein aMBF1 (putative translation factor)